MASVARLPLSPLIYEGVKGVRASISKSGDRCNYFVNDQKSLINVILPIFNYMELKSSKYFQYLIFEKAVNLLIGKQHLTPVPLRRMPRTSVWYGRGG
jgi:hypothetical protein